MKNLKTMPSHLHNQPTISNNNGAPSTKEKDAVITVFVKYKHQPT
jgi:hypothetical protein